MDIERDQRAACMVALDVCNRAVYFAQEAAPVGNVEQEVGIRGSLEFLDSRQRLRQLGPEPANCQFGVIAHDREPVRRNARGALRRDLAVRRESFSAFRASRGGRLEFLFHRHVRAYSARGDRFWTRIRATYQLGPFLTPNS